MRIWESPAVRITELLLIRCLRRRRIYLISTHYQNLAAFGVVGAKRQRLLGKQGGDGIGRVKPIAQIGDEIDPNPTFRMGESVQTS